VSQDCCKFAAEKESECFSEKGCVNTEIMLNSRDNSMVRKSPRCLYSANIKDFLCTDSIVIYGVISQSFHGEENTNTKEAWMGEIEVMKDALSPWRDENAYVIFEYDIPRLGKRIDVVVLLKGLVFCLEFKVGKKDALQCDVEQVLDYALDLKNFHLFSADKYIVPILVPTEYHKGNYSIVSSPYNDGIFNPSITGAANLNETIRQILEIKTAPINEEQWGTNWIISPYSPTPTIVEAARSLYQNHSVEDITRHEADKVSTDATIACIQEIIEKTKNAGEKSICFVTGVPGAGKTLVGLDVAIKQTYKDGVEDKDNGAVYLSGNGPLVAVLTEALARDNYKKCRDKGEDKKLSDSRREVGKAIQIIHRYRDNMLAKIKNPVVDGKLEIDPEKAVRLQDTGYGEVEHVAIFDEAQRSWTHKRLADYLKRGGTYGNKLKVPNFPVSEASFLIWSLDQRDDWAVIICLVGGGQEINTGEAGIAEWIKALNDEYKHWNVYISNKLTQPEYAEGRVNELLQHNQRVTFSERLHLAVSLRSFRAETLSEFIHCLLSFDDNAKSLYKDIVAKNYLVLLTRDMDKARAWLRQQARGSQQTGVLVSKVAARFKPLAVNILPQGDEPTVHWFLEDKMDVRSSNYLEDAATEIQVQGLELDYACVLWDADMRCLGEKWEYYKFSSNNSKWTKVNNESENGREAQMNMLNAYRVLLTRARQGIVICVPEGNHNKNAEGFDEDPTRLPEFYNGTYEYLKSIGIKEL